MRRGQELFRGVDSGPEASAILSSNAMLDSASEAAYVRDLMGEHEVGRALVRRKGRFTIAEKPEEHQFDLPRGEGNDKLTSQSWTGPSESPQEPRRRLTCQLPCPIARDELRQLMLGYSRIFPVSLQATSTIASISRNIHALILRRKL